MKAIWLRDEIDPALRTLNSRIKDQAACVVELAKSVKLEQLEYDEGSWWYRLTHDNPSKVWFGTYAYNVLCDARVELRKMTELLTKINCALANNAATIMLSSDEINYLKG